MAQDYVNTSYFSNKQLRLTYPEEIDASRLFGYSKIRQDYLVVMWPRLHWEW